MPRPTAVDLASPASLFGSLAPIQHETDRRLKLALIAASLPQDRVPALSPLVHDCLTCGYELTVYGQCGNRRCPQHECQHDGCCGAAFSASQYVDTRPRWDYRLVTGEIVSVIADHGEVPAYVITYQLAGGRVVTALRVDDMETVLRLMRERGL